MSEIRDEAIKRVAKAFFGLIEEELTWDNAADHYQRQFMSDAEVFVNALGELLPTEVETRLGPSEKRADGWTWTPFQARYVTEWRER